MASIDRHVPCITLQTLLMLARLYWILEVTKQMYYVSWCELLEMAFRNVNMASVCACVVTTGCVHVFVAHRGNFGLVSLGYLFIL